MPRPRIAVVSPFIDKRHGTERSVAECLERLSADYEIHLYSQQVADLNLDGITWHRIPRLPGPHLVGYIWWFLANRICRWRDRRFRKLQPDMVFSPGINCLDADAIYVHVIFAQLRRHMKEQLRFGANPLLTWPQILHRRIYYSLIAALERRVYSRTEVPLIVVSRKSASDLLQHYSRDANIRVAYNGLDLRRFNPERRNAQRVQARMQLDFSPNDCVLLLIGNDWRSKGLPCLLDAVGKISNRNIHILVAGQGDPTAFQDSIRRNQLDGRVSFKPSRSDVEFYYAAADVYASPTLEDAFALPPAEAMACGLPVITSVNNGGAEAIVTGESGFVLDDPLDSDALADLIKKLSIDPCLRQRIGDRAVVAARNLTWDKAAEQIRAAWEQALASRRTAQPK